MNSVLDRLRKWGEDCPKYYSEVPADVSLDELPGWIIHEDDNLLIINKPGWLVCHPAKRGPMSSLVSACREYCSIEKLHLVNRLDRETSGVVMIAKDLDVARECRSALDSESTAKIYVAVLNGVMKGEVTINAALVDDEVSQVSVKQRVKEGESGAFVKTEFLPLANDGSYTFARVKLHSGKKHQIRTHAAFTGNYIVGDKIYGPDETLYLEFIKNGWTERMEKELHFPRQALHARELTILGRTYIAELPEDMSVLVGAIASELNEY